MYIKNTSNKTILGSILTQNNGDSDLNINATIVHQLIKRSYEEHDSFVSACVVWCTSILAAPSDMRADCPTDIPPLVGDAGYAPWNTAYATFLVAGTTNCYALYHYCWRSVNGQIQCWISDVEPSGTWGTGCNDLYWSDILNQARENVFQQQYSILEPCNQMNIIITVYTSQCAQFRMTGIPATPECFLCDGTAYCEEACQACDGLGVVITSNCSWTNVGTADCSALTSWSHMTISDVINNTYELGPTTCYTIGCN